MVETDKSPFVTKSITVMFTRGRLLPDGLNLAFGSKHNFQCVAATLSQDKSVVEEMELHVYACTGILRCMIRAKTHRFQCAWVVFLCIHKIC